MSWDDMRNLVSILTFHVAVTVPKAPSDHCFEEFLWTIASHSAKL